MKKIFLSLILVLGLNVYSAHHKEAKVAAKGLISSEIFDLAGEMDLYVERYQSCGQATGAKHLHPFGTLVYVLDGQSQTNASGEYEIVNKGEYWFERSNWVHGGQDPKAPKVDENQCSQTLTIRVAKKGESPTVFLD